jgi:TM2 domain-containing membrane protein YozV/ribosomal protein L40E
MFCRNCGNELIGTPEICMGCGARPASGNSFCMACGAATNPMAEICIKCGTRLARTKRGARVVSGDGSPKSRLVTTLLAFIIGTVGAHRFYAGKYGTAVVMLLLFIAGVVLMVISNEFTLFLGAACLGAVELWAFIDFIFAVLGKFKDSDGRPISNWSV